MNADLYPWGMTLSEQALTSMPHSALVGLVEDLTALGTMPGTTENDELHSSLSMLSDQVTALRAVLDEQIQTEVLASLPEERIESVKEDIRLCTAQMSNEELAALTLDALGSMWRDFDKEMSGPFFRNLPNEPLESALVKVSRMQVQIRAICLAVSRLEKLSENARALLNRR